MVISLALLSFLRRVAKNSLTICFYRHTNYDTVSESIQAWADPTGNYVSSTVCLVSLRHVYARMSLGT
jgi:hypothetical protein